MSKSIFFKRSKHLLSMATKVAAKEAGLQLSGLIKNVKSHEIAKDLARIKQAQAITKHLSQLKGAAMKAGQLLSIDSSQFLPPEAIEVLSQLQSQAEPEKFEVMKAVLDSELNEAVDLLQNLSVQPIAAASIGQVHKAVYENKDVAVKIQYPNIEESIDSDLEILKKITKVFLFSTQKEIDLTSTFEELKFVLKLESDYQREAQILKKVHEKLIDHSFFYAPKPVEVLTTKKVLTMEFCEGVTLNQWIQTQPSLEDKSKVAQGILDLFILEFLDWKIVQTDPNFGNYLIQTEPLKVILLDFGSTLEYSTDFISEYLNTLFISSRKDAAAIFHQAVEFGLLDAREGPEVEASFFELMLLSVEPFLSEQQPFDFSSVDYESRSRQAVLKFTKSLKYSPPPRKVLFLHRKLGGIFSLLRRLNVKIDLKPHWDQLMDNRGKGVVR